MVSYHSTDEEIREEARRFLSGLKGNYPKVYVPLYNTDPDLPSTAEVSFDLPGIPVRKYHRLGPGES